MAPLRAARPDMEVGAYDLGKGETCWFGPEDLDDDLDLLRATCALPHPLTRMVRSLPSLTALPISTPPTSLPSARTAAQTFACGAMNKIGKRYYVKNIMLIS